MNEDAAGPTETTIRRMGLRSGGWIGYDEEAVFVHRDDEAVKIYLDRVAGISLEPVEWDMAIMSVLLLGVGAYVGATRNLPVGVAFSAIGLWSLYRTYRKRYELVVHVDDEPKPVGVHPTHPSECRDRLATVLRDHGGGSEPA